MVTPGNMLLLRLLIKCTAGSVSTAASPAGALDAASGASVLTHELPLQVQVGLPVPDMPVAIGSAPGRVGASAWLPLEGAETQGAGAQRCLAECCAEARRAGNPGAIGGGSRRQGRAGSATWLPRMRLSMFMLHESPRGTWRGSPVAAQSRMPVCGSAVGQEGKLGGDGHVVLRCGAKPRCEQARAQLVMHGGSRWRDSVYHTVYHTVTMQWRGARGTIMLLPTMRVGMLTVTEMPRLTWNDFRAVALPATTGALSPMRIGSSQSQRPPIASPTRPARWLPRFSLPTFMPTEQASAAWHAAGQGEPVARHARVEQRPRRGQQTLHQLVARVVAPAAIATGSNAVVWLPTLRLGVFMVAEVPSQIWFGYGRGRSFMAQFESRIDASAVFNGTGSLSSLGLPTGSHAGPCDVRILEDSRAQALGRRLPRVLGHRPYILATAAKCSGHRRARSGRRMCGVDSVMLQ